MHSAKAWAWGNGEDKAGGSVNEQICQACECKVSQESKNRGGKGRMLLEMIHTLQGGDKKCTAFMSLP